MNVLYGGSLLYKPTAMYTPSTFYRHCTMFYPCTSNRLSRASTHTPTLATLVLNTIVSTQTRRTSPHHTYTVYSYSSSSSSSPPYPSDRAAPRPQVSPP